MVIPMLMMAMQAVPIRPAPVPNAVPSIQSGPSPQAQGVGTPEERDVRCLAAYALLGTQGEAAINSGKIGATFFYGKLVGRDPAIDLVLALRTGARQAAGNLPGELIRCSGELQAASQAMLAAGNALRGAAGSPPR